jgi:hypothetical protein
MALDIIPLHTNVLMIRSALGGLQYAAVLGGRSHGKVVHNVLPRTSD